ncbi:MAG: tryptophan-rich sensory protein [Xenococcaceae cyanobacterium MO_188.B32]|nr:tryptophan-rich sensory protein [Xenococcaceae cyanobacterium MO_188.B32]
MELNRNLIRQIVNFLAIATAFGINILANVNPPRGMTIGDISDRLFGNVLITPANYAFAIWGVIYLGLFGFAIYQALPNQQENSILQKLGYSIAIASLAQIILIFCFLYRQFALSFVLMVAILVSLVWAYLSLPIPLNKKREKWLIYVPLSTYLAWISVATIVNGATVLEYWQWDGWAISPPIWTVIMLLVAGVIGVIMAIEKNVAFVGVYIWALVAIAANNYNTTIITITSVGIAIILALTLLLNIILFTNSPVSRYVNRN